MSYLIISGLIVLLLIFIWIIITVKGALDFIYNEYKTFKETYYKNMYPIPIIQETKTHDLKATMEVDATKYSIDPDYFNKVIARQLCDDLLKNNFIEIKVFKNSDSMVYPMFKDHIIVQQILRVVHKDC